MECRASNLNKPVGGGAVEPPPIESGRPAVAASAVIGLSWKVRLFGALLVFLSGPVLAVGLWLKPNVAGLGTHMQLGYGPCPFYTRYGIPCPTCGYTTAVSHVAHGQWIAAIVTQPAGAVIGFLLLSAFIAGLMAVIRGRWYGPGWLWFGLRLERIIIIAAALFLGAWLYKVWVAGALKPPHW